MLHHQDAVADPDPESAARTALADDEDEDRGLELEHLEDVLGDRRGLAALLGADPRVGARRVDQADDRDLELRREAHLAQRLAVSLGVRTAEVERHALLRRATLPVPDEQEPPLPDPREPGQDCLVVAEHLVAVELDEVVQDLLDVVGDDGSVRVARDVDPLPGRQVRVDPLDLGREALLERVDLAGEIEVRALVDLLELGQLGLDLADRALERHPAGGRVALRALGFGHRVSSRARA